MTEDSKKSTETRESDPVESTEAETQSARTRFWLTNDLLAGLLIISFIALVVAEAAGFFDLSTIPSNVLSVYLTIVGIANVWAFGGAAYMVWKNH